MKLKRKLLSTLVVLGLAGAGLTACSPGGGGSSSEDSLVVWNYEDPTSAQGQAWAKAIEIFKSENPGVKVTFSQQAFTSTKNNAKVIFSGNKVPDVSEFNKGAADTGQLASQGLLEPLTEQVEKYGWDEKLDTPSLQTLSKYSTSGQPGSGDWYGIPNYGEYILWYYNKDYFAENGLTVPTTRAEFDTLLATIKDKGTTPIAASAKEYPIIHSWFQYVLQDAPEDWVEDYQLFEGDVDWDASYWKDGTQDVVDQVNKGYVDQNLTGIDATQMYNNFVAQKSPLMQSGSWFYGQLEKQASFEWDTFLAPEQNLNEGSVGNLWVVPTKAKNKENAYKFIDITLRPEIQNMLGELGGLPVAGDPSKITDPKTQAFTENFNTLTSENKLAFYPDFPFPGYYDFMLSEGQSLANESKTADEVVANLEQFYEKGRADIESRN